MKRLPIALVMISVVLSPHRPFGPQKTITAASRARTHTQASDTPTTETHWASRLGTSPQAGRSHSMATETLLSAKQKTSMAS